MVDLKKIKIKDNFFSKHVDLVRNEIIPYQWEVMNDRIPEAEPSHCLENFKIAAKLKDGEFYGAVFQDTDIAKWLEAVGFTLASYNDPELEKTADEVIDLIGKAQQPDGYLNTYFTIKEPNQRWKNLCEGHELYTAGHMMEAAVSYYLGTGKSKFLNIMEKNADLICDTFGFEEGKIHGYPGHQEIEIGLIKLFRVTGKKKYLDTAKYFIDARGVSENYFLKEMKRPDYKPIFPEFRNYDPSYSQSHLPVREQKTAEGHSVRATYMYAAMADLAYEYNDSELLRACEELWDNIVKKRMYITGGIGSSGILERFTTDYDLPNDRCYCESCASIGLMMFGIRMLNITKDSKYADIIEKALYNTVLAGVALDGQSFFYVNPLEVFPPNCLKNTSMEHVKPVRQKWFSVACCPPNIARTLASLGQYMYSVSDDTIYFNLFISNKSEIQIKDNSVEINMFTEFPNKNEITASIKNISSEIKLAFRIPDYSSDYKIHLNDKEISFDIVKGYAIVILKEDGDFKITFEAKAKFVKSNPLVRYNMGKIAVVKGPQVFCIEEIDNGKNLTSIYVDSHTEPKETSDGAIELQGIKISEDEFKEENLYFDNKKLKTENIKIKAIPYSYWSNRSEGEMAVWLNELN